jgi:glycosyltransferase involved in cell wall biosynthesis
MKKIDSQTLVSVIIPAKNEQDSLKELCLNLLDVFSDDDTPLLEILFIDDGSTDQTWSILCDLHKEHTNVYALRFNKNYGKSAALAAGISRANGSIVVTIDADLQDDPKEIPNLLNALDDGFDLVSGWKKERHDPWHKKAFSKVFNGIVSRVSGIQLHDFNCGLKAYRKEVFSHIRLYGEMHRFIPVLAANYGFRITEIPVTHHPRKFGRSKFGFERVLRAALDFVTVGFFTRYMQRPSHFFGPIGVVAGMMALVVLCVGLGVMLIGNHLVGGIVILAGVLLGMLGVHSIFFGLLAEILTFMNRREEPFYFVNETLD